MSEAPVSAKPAVKSLTLQSLVTIAVAMALGRVGAVLPEGMVHDIAGAAIDLASMIGMIGASIGRARAKSPIG